MMFVFLFLTYFTLYKSHTKHFLYLCEILSVGPSEKHGMFIAVQIAFPRQQFLPYNFLKLKILGIIYPHELIHKL